LINSAYKTTRGAHSCANPQKQICKFSRLIRESQIRIFLQNIQNNAQLGLRPVLRGVFFLTIIYYFCRLAKVFKNWACKSQIRKVPHLREVRKGKKFINSANLRLYNFSLSEKDHHKVYTICKKNLVNNSEYLLTQVNILFWRSLYIKADVNNCCLCWQLVIDNGWNICMHTV
jgi:hypothetical protein